MVGNFFNKQPPHTLRITKGIKAKKKKKKIQPHEDKGEKSGLKYLKSK